MVHPRPTAWRTYSSGWADGQPSGVVIDGAQSLVTSRIPRIGRQQLEDQIQLAYCEMRRVGITTVDDAGADAETVDDEHAPDRSGHDQDATVCDVAGDPPTN